MFKAFKESQRRHGPWHIAVFLMFGIIAGIIGLYYLLSKNLIYCPIGDTDATFSLTYDDRGVLSQVGGLKFWVPANYTLFLHNQRSGKHKWLVLHGLLPGLRALTEKLGMLEQNKLDDCDFYIKDKVVIALAQKNPRPRWLDRGGIDKKSAAKLLQGTVENIGPYGLLEHRSKVLKDYYDNYPFQKIWLFSHVFRNKRRVFFYCWRDKIGSQGCYTHAEPLGFLPEAKKAGISMKYFFHRNDLERWREIDREARALVRSFYEAGKNQR